MIEVNRTRWGLGAVAVAGMVAGAVWAAGIYVGVTGAVRPVKPKGPGSGAAETVSAASAPAGPASGLSGQTYVYSTGGATSSFGHTVEYRFNWGDGTYSPWSVSTSASHAWAADGAYTVTAEARCQADTAVVAPASGGLAVGMATETIGAPTAPTGTITGGANSTYAYSTGGATSNLGHAVEYRFNWGDGTYSSWSAAGSDSYAWTSTGSYTVTAEARCQEHTWVTSAASSGLAVSIITESVSAPDTPTGTKSGVPGTSYLYTTGNATSNLGHTVEYRLYWGDSQYSTWSAGTSASHAWSSGGSYSVMAEARCQADTGVTSASAGSMAVSMETVTPPPTPTGPTDGVAGATYTYTTTGSTTSLGHTVEYKFDWGDGTYSSWSTSMDASHSWSAASTYVVKVQARCQSDTGVLSSWSGGVTMVLETVSIPTPPTGTASGSYGTSYGYTTGGSTSNLGHTVEYRFDWGTGTNSTWSTSTTVSYTFTAAGSYTVKAQARCQADTTVVSSWSGGMGVVMGVPSGTITTIAGDGSPGTGCESCAAETAQFNGPCGVAVDTAGNIYVADTNNHRIRKITSGGVVTTIAGVSGSSGFGGDSGAGTSAYLNQPWAVTWNSSANVLYIADTGNHRIRMLNLGNGIINTVVNGTPGTAGYNGDGGNAYSAQLFQPMGVWYDAGASNLYIGDTMNSRLRMVNNSNIISTVGGNGTYGCSTSALGGPAGVTLKSGNLYVADEAYNVVRLVSGGTGNLFAGSCVSAGYNGDGIAATSAWLNMPIGVAVNGSGAVFIGDMLNHRVRKVAGGTITTVAGTGTAGYNGDNQLGTAAQVYDPAGVAVATDGTLYIADRYNHRIRKVTP
ncbi:MAG: hypothetical protein AAB152_01450 [Candidatus Coatesbacteria bacterium]